VVFLHDVKREAIGLFGKQEASERLEPYEGKLSRTVLRGGDFGNEVSLPDGKEV